MVEAEKHQQSFSCKYLRNYFTSYQADSASVGLKKKAPFVSFWSHFMRNCLFYKWHTVLARRIKRPTEQTSVALSIVIFCKDQVCLLSLESTWRRLSCTAIWVFNVPQRISSPFSHVNKPSYFCEQNVVLNYRRGSGFIVDLFLADKFIWIVWCIYAIAFHVSFQNMSNSFPYNVNENYCIPLFNYLFHFCNDLSFLVIIAVFVLLPPLNATCKTKIHPNQQFLM